MVVGKSWRRNGHRGRQKKKEMKARMGRGCKFNDLCSTRWLLLTEVSLFDFLCRPDKNTSKVH